MRTVFQVPNTQGNSENKSRLKKLCQIYKTRGNVQPLKLLLAEAETQTKIKLNIQNEKNIQLPK